MSISSLSLTFAYSNTSDMARARDSATPTPAALPVAAPAEPVASSCDHPGRDTLRRSPLYRALFDALESLVGPSAPSTPAATAAVATGPAETPAVAATPGTSASVAAAATSATTDPAATTTTAATPTPDAAPVGLDEAVMNFARALMQALRGALHGEGASEGASHRHQHHHHPHHDHGRRAWGNPAQRIAELGLQLGAAAPAPSPAMTTPVDPAPVDTAANDTAAPTLADSVLEPAVATPLPLAGAPTVAAPANLTLNVTVNFKSPWSTTPARPQQSLVEAFGLLEKARGESVDERDDDRSLKAQLGAFLQRLADELRLGDGDVADPTAPGALLHVTA